MRYYTLVIQDPETLRWSPEFGDYDRETVEQERDDQIDSEACTFLTSRVITTEDTQADIDATVAAMNSKRSK